MRSHRHLIPVLLVSASVLVACDKPSPPDGEPPATAGSVDAAEPGTCAGYEQGDPCVDERAFTQCQEAEAQCPGEVSTLESCPLQFACP